MLRLSPIFACLCCLLTVSCASHQTAANFKTAKPSYTIRRVSQAPAFALDWDAWEDIADTLVLEQTWPQNRYNPRVSVRVVHDNTAIHGIFRVEDKYIRVTHVGIQKPVYKDACVEFFFRTDAERDEYVNLEMNAGGSYLFNTNIDPLLADERGVQYFAKIPLEYAQRIRIKTTLPERIEPEITADTTWLLQFTIPLDAMPPTIHRPESLSGQHWTGNFYKCANDSSHPHYLSWTPLPRLSFHIPNAFGTLLFE